MRLVRLGPAGSETPGALVDDDTYIDLSDVVHDFDEAFFGSGALETLAVTVAERLSAGRGEPVGDRRFGAPIARPHQILCIGLNYRDHAAETDQAVPTEPILFTKSPNTLIGPDDDVLIPKNSVKTDWEVELGVVVGSHASYLEDETAAEAAIAGYVLVNDVSEREWQIERNGQWSKGKSAPTFNPAGPWLVTKDEIEDVLALEMTLDIDGERRQTGSTSTMVFSPAFIVHYLSQFMALEPGDLINTGTPPGVGMGKKPPVYLKGGETMTLNITRLGTQTQRVVAHPAAQSGTAEA
ncbi:fumarylacetoacetate hydrolase family protein [Naasia lichenicola]|uniref:Fumarylacetoacetate hydrolase family protein n=1 Tax=Naasia lichenicola TaxID=2565933 RepID=A0A4S4FH45_9MICO|nr:fumarylacetoacetate hydrolase family protein [Naasia lichenicola]THG29620.1 fumarylacetoacetate hydrolase family protein [Naasia lichenicola]